MTVRTSYTAICVCVCIVSWLAIGSAERVLLMPVGNESHFVEFHGVGRYLSRMGHEVFVLFGEPDAQLPAYAAETKYSVVKFRTNLTWMTQRGEEALIIGLRGSLSALASAVREKSQQYCEDLFADGETFNKLHALHFDAVIVDSLSVVRCYLLLVRQLAIRNVVMLGTPLESWHARLPLLASVMEPQANIGKYIGYVEMDALFDDGSFFKRVLNTIGALLLESWLLADDLNTFTIDATSTRSLVSLHLVNRDHVLDSNVYPEMPNVKLVGGLGNLPPRPLNGALKEFADSADNGLVVLTFGSMFSVLTEEIRSKLLLALLNMTELKFVIKMDPQVVNETLSAMTYSSASHILAMQRVPQNDLLAHRNTKLFVTHSGNNGQFEALAHGVPMVAMYLYADQIDNAKRVHKRQFGVKLDVYSFTPQLLIEAVRSVVANSTYRERIRSASRFFHSNPHPGEKAALLVDQLIKFGPQYFQPADSFPYEMNVAQFYNLDVYLLLFSVLSLSALACVRVCYFLFVRLVVYLYDPTYNMSCKQRDADADADELRPSSLRDRLVRRHSASESSVRNRTQCLPKNCLDLFEVD